MSLSPFEERDFSPPAASARLERPVTSLVFGLVLSCLLLGLALSWGLHQRHAGRRAAGQAEGWRYDYGLINAKQASLIEFLASPETQLIHLQATHDAPEQTAALAWNPRQQAGVLFGEQLAPLSSEQKYHLWLIGEANEPIDGGAFDAVAGSAVHRFRINPPVQSSFVVLITAQPKTAAPSPDASILPDGSELFRGEIR